MCLHTAHQFEENTTTRVRLSAAATEVLQGLTALLQEENPDRCSFNKEWLRAVSTVRVEQITRLLSALTKACGYSAQRILDKVHRICNGLQDATSKVNLIAV